MKRRTVYAMSVDILYFYSILTIFNKTQNTNRHCVEGSLGVAV